MEKMATKKREWVLKKGEIHFFEALLLGYASTQENKKPKSVKDFKIVKIKSNTKNITTFFDGFEIVDEWVTNTSSEFSAGTTTIYYKENPVWRMSYFGFHKKECINFLIKALAKAYLKKKFIGGRGPEFFEDASYIYKNEVIKKNFEAFRGTESIHISINNKGVGIYQYMGIALI